MKYWLAILFFVNLLVRSGAQNSVPDYKWDASCYFNLDIGESICLNKVTIRLLRLDHQYTTLLVNNDTVQLQVARQSLPVMKNNIQMFVADNRNVANLTPGDPAHGLLKKDALVCVSEVAGRWLNPNRFIFPVSFNDGFSWRGDEDSYFFSLCKTDDNETLYSYPGVGIDLSGARRVEKHWFLAIEKSNVVWVEEPDKNTACVLLQSEESPRIYYVYDKLHSKTLEVHKGQQIEKGELIGTAWGDDKWCHLQFSVIFAEVAPDYVHRYENCLNFFPQLFRLYYNRTFILSNFFTKGQIEFGRKEEYNGNTKNVSAFEEYLGKGWKPCSWNTAEKLDWVSKGAEGNVRIAKTLFRGTPAEVTNPNDYCEYEINVQNGVYRIRCRVGDVERTSWQKMEFENIPAGTFSLTAGEQKWTPEKVVTIIDNKLTVRIYFDVKTNEVAGLSELVFQQVY